VIILPHRLVTSVSQVSAVGAVSWRGRNPSVMKINQDAVVVAEHGPTNSLLVAVFDGHGVNGREVSAYFKERYPLALFTDKRFFAKLDSKKGLSRSPSPTHSKEGSTVDDDGASITSDSGPASGLYLSPNARSGKHAGGSTSPNSRKHATTGASGSNSNASSALCDVMADVLLSTELALIQSSGINCTLSGSTSVVVLIREGVLHIVNVGDSRGILAAAPQPTVPISSSAIAAASSAATQTGNPVPGLVPGQHLEAAEEANAQLSHPAVRIRVLTVDHKPDMPRERQRILTCGGRVLSTRVKGAPHLLGPPRVWLKNAPLPGLNMSRSLGDLIAKQAGVVSTPHKAVHNISASDRALILASDGLWDFVSNEETGSLALSTSDSWDASARLARLSRSRWLTRTGGADDTTVVVVRLGGEA
jgi:serine/threonine protein phosphatase PrpC